jgi:2'-5' RNA ligase
VLVEKLRASLPRASWTRPESWHLTLRFLGEISDADASAFADALDQRRVGAVSAAELHSAGPVAFPSRGRPRVLGVGLAQPASLEALWRAGAEAARRIGLPPEHRSFHPHLTLARVRDPWPRPAVEAFWTEVENWAPPPWRFSSCVLFSSRLNPAGAVHTPVRTWELAAAGQEVGA